MSRQRLINKAKRGTTSSATPLFLQSLGARMIRFARRPKLDLSSKPKQTSKRTLAPVVWAFNHKATIVLVLVAAVLLTGGLLVHSILTVPLRPFPHDMRTAPKEILGSRMNVLMLLYQNNGKYQFVDALLLVVADSRSQAVQVIPLHPELATSRVAQGYIPLKNIMSNAELQDERPIEVVEDITEDILGMPIDRYLAVRTEDFSHVLDTLGFGEYKATFAVDDPEISVAKDEVISGDKLVGYLAADKPGFDAKLQRAERFIQDARARLDWLTFMRGVMNASALADSIYTNMSRFEITSLALLAINYQKFGFDTLRAADTIQIVRQDRLFRVPNRSTIDERLKALFRSESVLREQARLEVYNGAGVTGLASRYQRYLGNVGVNVVRVGNYPEDAETTVLYVTEPEKYAANIEVIKQVLRGKVEMIYEPYPFNYSGEMVLVLGADIV